ncbi:hypothetical protein [Sphaerisporangium sp. B11E5]
MRLACAGLILVAALLSAAGAVFATARMPHVTPGSDCTERSHPSA